MVPDQDQRLEPADIGWAYWRPAVDGIVELGTLQGREVALPTHYVQGERAAALGKKSLLRPLTSPPDPSDCRPARDTPLSQFPTQVATAPMARPGRMHGYWKEPSTRPR